MPPSPADVPGLRFLDPPAFTHWPAVQYRDEARHAAFVIHYHDPALWRDPIAFAVPPALAGTDGVVGWEGAALLPITLPPGQESISGLLDLPGRVGERRASIIAGPLTRTLPIRTVAVDQPWPHARLRDGFPVDADDVPVVLLAPRNDPDAERRLAALAGRPPRGTAPAWLVGDPFAGPGGDCWPSDTQAGAIDRRVATDLRHPAHAALVACAPLGRQPAPRTICWSPGNAAVRAGAWTNEEERVLTAVRERCRALGVAPRLVLALPPAPPETRWAAVHAERRRTLTAAAAALGWNVLDLERVAGADPYRLAPQLAADAPVGAARERIRAALAETLTE